MITITRKTQGVPMDVLRQPADFDTLAAHAYTADTMPDMALAILLNIQDRIADAQMLVATMATAKEPGYLAHAAGQLNALQELWDDIEQRRQEACKL